MGGRLVELPDEGRLWLALGVAQVQNQGQIAVVDGDTRDVDDARNALLLEVSGAGSRYAAAWAQGGPLILPTARTWRIYVCVYVWRGIWRGDRGTAVVVAEMRDGRCETSCGQ